MRIAAKATPSSLRPPPLHMSGVLEATSQLSRFHLESITTDSSDVDIRGVHIAVGAGNSLSTELLHEARLVLKGGTHYGLIGRNGSGKSTLMRAIATRVSDAPRMPPS